MEEVHLAGSSVCGVIGEALLILPHKIFLYLVDFFIGKTYHTEIILNHKPWPCSLLLY